MFNTKLSGLFKTVDLSKDFTINPNEAIDISLPLSLPSGYEYFCTCRIDVGDIHPIALTSFYRNGSTLVVGIYNCGDSVINQNLAVTNVYLKSGFWG